MFYLEADTIREMPLDLRFISGCPHWRVWKLLSEVDWPAKKVYSGRMESILKGRVSQNDFNIYSERETMKVSLFF